MPISPSAMRIEHYVVVGICMSSLKRIVAVRPQQDYEEKHYRCDETITAHVTRSPLPFIICRFMRAVLHDRPLPPCPYVL